MRSNLLLACILALAHSASMAQDTLSLENIAEWQPTWRFFEGDNPAWSDPGFDDSVWPTVDGSSFDPGFVDSTTWTGVGWYRSTFLVDSTVAGVPIAYSISLVGAAGLYLDGALLDQLGQPSANRARETAVRFSDMHPHHGLLPALRPGTHHIAVRVSNFFLSDAGETEFGFKLTFSDPAELASKLSHEAALHSAKTYLLTGIAGVLALVYLLLFAFQPKQITNLYFGLVAGLAAFVIFGDFHSRTVSDPDTYLFWRRYVELAGVAGWIAAVRLIRLSFFKESWKLFPVLAVLAALVGLYVYLDPIGGFWSLAILGILATIELLRRIGLATFLSRPGAWIVAIGSILFIAGALNDYLHSLGWLPPALGLTDLIHFGLAGFLALVALFLATDFARANRALEMRMDQVHRDGQKALQEEKVNQDQRIGRIQGEFDNRRKEFEQEKSREVSGIRQSLTVAQEQMKEMKQKLVAVEGTAALGRLATGIAHDVQGVLKTLGDLTSLSVDLTDELQQSVEADSGKGRSADALRQLKRNMQRIDEQRQLAVGIIDDIVVHSSGSKDKTQSIDVNGLIDRYLNLAQYSARGEFPNLGLIVERDFDDRTGTAFAEPAGLGRALLAIFRNAVEAVAETAAESNDDFVPTITVSTQRLDNAVLVRVRDNGPGVPQDLRDRVFEPFFSTKSENSGLGLSIAHQAIVDEMDGTFGLEHFKEQGAGFYLTIPLTPRSNTAPGEEAASE